MTPSTHNTLHAPPRPHAPLNTTTRRRRASKARACMHNARGARRCVRPLPSARVDERAAMREAGRAARTERAQAAKRGLSWSGGEGDGDARDEHDECGAGSERSGVGGNGDACEDPDAQGVRGGERVRGLGVHGSDGCHSRARIIAAAAAEASATRAGSDGDDDTGSCRNDSCGGCCCDDAAVTARARLASAAPQLSPDSIDTPTRRRALPRSYR